MLQQRDDDIEAGQERILEAEKVLENQNESLEEENQMLRNEQKNNRELLMEIENVNSLNSRMRRELSDLQQDVYVIVNEVSLEEEQFEHFISVILVSRFEAKSNSIGKSFRKVENGKQTVGCGN